MHRTDGYVAEARRLAARCVTQQDALDAGHAFGRRVAADVRRWEAEHAQPNGTHRWRVDSALLKELEAAEAAQTDIAIGFYRTARNPCKAELNRPA